MNEFKEEPLAYKEVEKKRRENLDDSYIIKLIKRRRNRGVITPTMIKNKREEIKFKREQGSTPLRRTRPEEANASRNCYWYIEDGECSLNNPITRRRLTRYVFKQIKLSPWISKKTFIEADEVFSLVQEDIADLQPFQYGNENTPPIVFLIRKIRTKIQQEWVKYVKTTSPASYDAMRRNAVVAARVSYEKKKSTDQGIQEIRIAANRRCAKYRDEIADSYLLGNIQNDLKRQTGMKYTFDEIRKQFSDLIKRKRESIQNKRNGSKVKILPELDDRYLSERIKASLARKGELYSTEEIISKYPELIKGKREKMLKEREGATNVMVVPICFLRKTRHDKTRRNIELKIIEEAEESLGQWMAGATSPEKRIKTIESFEVSEIGERDVFYMLHVGKKKPVRFDIYEEMLVVAKGYAEKSKKDIFITKGIKKVEFKKYAV